MLGNFLNMFGTVTEAITHRKERAQATADERDRKQAWDAHIATGGVRLAKYVVPSDCPVPLLDQAALYSKLHRYRESTIRRNASGEYEVDPVAVARHNEKLTELMRVQIESLRSTKGQAEEEACLNRIAIEEEVKQQEQTDPNLVCESPAETLFLCAVIDEFRLKFDDGAFRGSGVNVRTQVSIGRYRVDFLFNDKVVVEIDGHEFHSGRANADRDARRDAKLRSLGYRLLRIPAYRVHHNPSAAVSDIQDFLR